MDFQSQENSGSGFFPALYHKGYVRTKKDIQSFLTSVRTWVRRIQNDTSPTLSTPSSLSLNFYFSSLLPCISLLKNFRLNSLSFFFFSLGNCLYHPTLYYRSIKTRPEKTRTSLKITGKKKVLCQTSTEIMNTVKMQ